MSPKLAILRGEMARSIALPLPRRDRRAILPFALFTAVQIADAFLTLTGVSRFGPAVEANPLVAFFISMCGATAGLVAVKGVAIAAGALLHIRWEDLILALLTVLLVFAAVVPWSWALAS